MRVVFFVLVTSLIAIAFGCDRFPGQPDEKDRYRRPSEILDFAALYTTNCSGCHGADGRHGPARSLADPVYLSLVDEGRLTSIVAAGIPGTLMPAFARRHGGTLDDAQVKALSVGMLDKWGGAPGRAADVSSPPYSEADSLSAGFSPGDAIRGGEVFGRYCANCHGEQGAGSGRPDRDGGSVVDVDFLALVSDQMLRTTVIAGRSDLGMPDWQRGLQTSSQQHPMTPQEISDVVAWLVDRRGR
jgi:cytochrome c oxidase cbb3-type subunit 3/ubiquinol-cytochrome c reductase cytochrome c subunit